jgi:lysophospholipase L1-like esterase
MSEPFLLSASLLTVGSISVPPPSVLPPNLPDNFCALFATSTPQTLACITTPKIFPILELIAAEFSFIEPRTHPISELITGLLPTPRVNSETTETLTDGKPILKPLSTTTTPVSGTQLYYQRLVALKTGKIYTGLPTDSFQSFWAKNAGKEALLEKPTHQQWIRILEQEAKAVAKGQGSNRLAILLGDSLTMWFPSERLPGGKIWLNQGISGENSGQILKRLSAFSTTKPDIIYLLAGINDLRQGATDAMILDNLHQILRRLRLKHPKSLVIVQSILPTRLTAIPNQRIRNLNEQIAIIAQQEGAGYLNLHTLFADSQGKLRQDLTTDGLHLSQRGYEVWQEALYYAESAIAANR